MFIFRGVFGYGYVILVVLDGGDGFQVVLVSYGGGGCCGERRRTSEKERKKKREERPVK